MPAVARVLCISVGAPLAGSLAGATFVWLSKSTDLFDIIRHLLGETTAKLILILLVALIVCLGLAAPEGLLYRSISRWLVIAGTVCAGAAVAGIIVFLNQEDERIGMVAGAIGCGAGYGLGAGIARKAWLAMIVGLLVGQLAGLGGGEAFVAFTGGRATGSFFWACLVCLGPILLPVTVALELVDVYLRRQGAGAPPAPVGGGAVPLPPSERSASDGEA
jgi:hypothetical protein